MQQLLVTIYDLDNYGNRLQNYAATKTVERLVCGLKNLIFINKLLFIKIHAKGILLHLINRTPINTRFMLFYDFSCKTKKLVYTKKKPYRRTTHFICGSDQIWNPKMGNEKMFLNFAPKEKRIAYAASFGVSSLPEDKKAEYAKYLSEMKAISVREESGARIVKELTGRDVPVLIDPTLMLDKEDWQKVSKKPNIHIPSRYLLTYFLGEVSEERDQYLLKTAKEHGLEIIRLEEHRQTEAWFKTGPSEFIWLIEHCALMCTDSFHGSVFSILMEVPFLVFNRKDSLADMSSRIDTLLSKFHLESHKFQDQSGADVFEKNYNHVRAILEQERQKAYDYLNEALNP